MKAYWQNLSDSEKRTLKIGGAVLALLLFVRLLWWPLFHRIDVMEHEMTQEAALIEWMQPRVARILQARKKPNENTQQVHNLSSFEKSLAESGLKSFVTDFNQSADQKIHVTFKAVPFEKLTVWLEQRVAQGYTLESLSVQRGSKTGLTDVVLVMAF